MTDERSELMEWWVEEGYALALRKPRKARRQLRKRAGKLGYLQCGSWWHRYISKPRNPRKTLHLP